MEVVGLLSHHDSWWCWYWGVLGMYEVVVVVKKGYLVVSVVVFLGRGVLVA